MSTSWIFSTLLAAGVTFANPIAKANAEAKGNGVDINLGPGVPTSSGIILTNVAYFGDGCPAGKLTGNFDLETSSFNVSLADLRAVLEDGKSNDDASCHIEVSFKTAAQIQLNLLQGDFHGSVFLEEKGMTALAHSSVSFAGTPGGSNIPWLWKGPVNAKAVYEHNLLAAFASECSSDGEFLMLIDIVLHVSRGSAAEGADGFVDVNQLTGALSQAYVIKESQCGKDLTLHQPSSQSSLSGGTYNKEDAKKKKSEKASKKKPHNCKNDDEKKSPPEERQFPEEDRPADNSKSSEENSSAGENKPSNGESLGGQTNDSTKKHHEHHHEAENLSRTRLASSNPGNLKGRTRLASAPSNPPEDNRPTSGH